MSWLFSQALVEEYLEANASDGEQSAPSSGNPIQQAYCAPDKMTTFSRRSLSGMTFKPLTEDHGEAVLTSYLAAFPVKTSHAPEREQGSQENDLPCGHTWRELCLKCDPATSSLKTVRCLWEEDLEPSSVTLPRWGMMQNGELWERTTLPRRIRETESGSSENWPTPTCQEVEYPDAELTDTGRRKSKDGKSSHSLNLADSVKMYPTPCARDYKGANAEDGLTRNDGKSRMDQLPNAVAYGDNPEPSGQLSPDWVEWLMGWPIGWTRLEPIELDERGWETDPADELPPSHTINTPTRSDYRGRGPNSSQQGLPDQVKREMGGGQGDIPRVATGIKARVDRLKAIGNGQVPQAAELAWRILTQ